MRHSPRDCRPWALAGPARSLALSGVPLTTLAGVGPPAWASPSARRRALLAVPASPSACALSLARSRSSPIYEAWSHHVLMSLCPALAAAAVETPPRDLRGEGPARGARGSKLCCAVPAAALARGPERAGPRRVAPTVSSSFSATAASRGPPPHDPVLLPGALPP